MKYLRACRRTPSSISAVRRRPTSSASISSNKSPGAMRGVQRVLIWAVLQSQRSDCAEDRENEEIIIQAEVPFAHGPSREYCRQPLPNRVLYKGMSRKRASPATGGSK